MFRISATDLVRRLGDILGRVRYRGEVILIERHNVPIAQIGPPPGARAVSLREAAACWAGSGTADAAFADDLERVNDADRPPTLKWGS
jgi:antitoxin (DNA-binding transcriptional repressor) of toxin-antitoxin stability system